MPVSYEGAQTLKCTVNFNFSRYINNSTAVAQAPYPVLGEDADSSAWVAGNTAENSNEGAQAAAFAAGDSRRAQIAREALADIEAGRRGDAQ